MKKLIEQHLAIKDYSISMLKLEVRPRMTSFGDPFKDGNILLHQEDENLNSQAVAKLIQLKKFLEQNYDEDCVIITDLNAENLETLDHAYLLSSIFESIKYDVKMLLGNAYWIDQVLPLTNNLLWIDHFYGSSFMVLYKTIYDEILQKETMENFNFLQYLSNLSSQKLLLYPFVPFDHEVPKANYKNIQMKIEMVRDIQYYYGPRLNAE